MDDESDRGDLPKITIGGVDISLDLNNRHERIYHSRKSGVQAPQADIDVKIFNKYLRAGDVALDAGGNIGITAAEMIECGARTVHVFEAHPKLIKRLQSIKSEKIVVHPCGLSDHVGQIDLFESLAHNQGSTTDSRIISMFPEIFENSVPIKIPVTTLDNLLGGRFFGLINRTRFDFMKVDIEGAEAAFLRGARKSLSRHCPRAMSMELYEPFFKEAYEEARRWYSKCYRALLSIDGYDLVLLNHDKDYDKSAYHSTSPMYVFCNEKPDQRGPARRVAGGLIHGLAPSLVGAFVNQTKLVAL